MPTVEVAFPRRINQLNINAVMSSIRAQLERDPQFRQTVKKDPIGVLARHGIPRTIAVAIVADDLGVRIRPPGSSASDITSCCCSGCSVSHLLPDLDEVVSLPARHDVVAWKRLAVGRAVRG